MHCSIPRPPVDLPDPPSPPPDILAVIHVARRGRVSMAHAAAIAAANGFGPREHGGSR